MQGASDGIKWSTVRGWMRGVQIALLQETGSGPPGSARSRPDITTADGHQVVHGVWNPGTGERIEGPYEVYWLETDTNPQGPGRVNIAVVTVGTPDEIRVVENPVAAGRRALGVRFGSNWYFTFHGLSGTGGDSAAMIEAIDDTVRVWAHNANADYEWTVGGDFNVPPGTIRSRPNMPADAHIYSTGRPTRPSSGRELDYVVSSQLLHDHPRFLLEVGTSDHEGVQLGGLRAGAEPVELRLTAAGDSNTEGFKSSHGNGYRDWLRYVALASLTLLSKRSVDFVGSRNGGNMEDPHHEGKAGEEIDQIAARLAHSVPAHRPNIVTLMAGTNDMANGKQEGAPQRLGRLVDQILGDSLGVTVVVATLIKVKDDQALQSRIDSYNAQVRTLVQQRQDAGKKVLLVEMNHLTAADMSDQLHPNDQGYKKMGDTFAGGLMQAIHNGWITPPTDVTRPECSDEPRRWEVREKIATGVDDISRRAVYFADMNGDGRDDYVAHDTETWGFDVYINQGGDQNGKPGWQPHKNYASGVEHDIMETFRFADVNGDGRDDYLIIDIETGAVDAYINQGGDKDGKPGWTVRRNFATGTGQQGRIDFADINGDRRADYLTIDSTIKPVNGATHAWINRGGDTEDTPGWEPRGKIAEGVPVKLGDRIEFANHDCDGKADYWVLRNNGAVDVWINKGGDTSENKTGWYERGRTAAGTGGSADGKTVRFGDVDGDGRDDYLVVSDGGAVDAYLNRGGDPV